MTGSAVTRSGEQRRICGGTEPFFRVVAVEHGRDVSANLVQLRHPTLRIDRARFLATSDPRTRDGGVITFRERHGRSPV